MFVTLYIVELAKPTFHHQSCEIIISYSIFVISSLSSHEGTISNERTVVSFSLPSPSSPSLLCKIIVVFIDMSIGRRKTEWKKKEERHNNKTRSRSNSLKIITISLHANATNITNWNKCRLFWRNGHSDTFYGWKTVRWHIVFSCMHCWMFTTISPQSKYVCEKLVQINSFIFFFFIHVVCVCECVCKAVLFAIQRPL